MNERTTVYIPFIKYALVDSGINIFSEIRLLKGSGHGQTKTFT